MLCTFNNFKIFVYCIVLLYKLKILKHYNNNLIKI